MRSRTKKGQPVMSRCVATAHIVYQEIHTA
jgi:hypothetical protein